MFFVLQFPISDARQFRADRQGRLDSPHWPTPVVDIPPPEFVHCFGRVVRRRRGADMAWTDELSFCRANRAIRFIDNLGKLRLGPPAVNMRPQLAFRRLFCDGSTLVRVEVGFAHHFRTPRLSGLDAAAVLSIVQDACGLESRVRRPENSDFHVRPLLQQGKALAQLYAHASTALAQAHPLDGRFVQPGNPVVLVELERRESIDPPPAFTTIDPQKMGGALVSFGRCRTTAGVVGVWLIQRGSADASRLRSLRLCLLRLHAEQESLDLILTQVRNRSILAESDENIAEDLNKYFNKATRLINRDKWGGVSQSAILEAFDAAEEVAPPDYRLNLADRFQGACQQVWRKLEHYQARRDAICNIYITNIITGDLIVEKMIHVENSGKDNIIIVDSYLSNVTNQINTNLSKSAAPDEAQDLMKQLLNQIKDIASKIDPEKLVELGNDAETLSKEMARPEPRQPWYEITLKGLKEAAIAIGEIGKPILETIQSLLPILLK